MSSAYSKVGFLGLGAMGLGMAARLVQKGFDVTGFDLDPTAMLRLSEQGGQAADTARAAAEGKDAVIVAVATAEQATSVLLDPEKGAAEVMPHSCTILLCITASPAYVRSLKAKLIGLGRPDLKLVDCPISGGETRAWKGDLSLICSGNDTDIMGARNMLESLGSQIHTIQGGLSGASSVKMVHQILVGVHILASVEVMGLCAVAGLDAQQVYDEVTSSEANSWIFGQRAAHIIEAKRAPPSSLMIITKDLAMLNEETARIGAPVPLASAAYQLFKQTLAAGHAQDDCRTIDLYLSGRGALESFPAVEPAADEFLIQTSGIDAKVIQDLLTGIHSAAAVEALVLADRLRIRPSTLQRVVKDAAGSSVVFGRVSSHFGDERHVSLAGIPNFEKTTMNLAAGVQRAAVLGYPTFLASAALQQLLGQNTT